jgi:hypothetical protein
LTRKLDGEGDNGESMEDEELTDPMSQQFINISAITRVRAIFRNECDRLSVVYSDYLKSLHSMQSMDLELPDNERPTTLNKLLKRHYKVVDDPRFV